MTNSVATSGQQFLWNLCRIQRPDQQFSRLSTVAPPRNRQTSSPNRAGIATTVRPTKLPALPTARTISSTKPTVSPAGLHPHQSADLLADRSRSKKNVLLRQSGMDQGPQLRSFPRGGFRTKSYQCVQMREQRRRFLMLRAASLQRHYYRELQPRFESWGSMRLRGIRGLQCCVSGRIYDNLIQKVQYNTAADAGGGFPPEYL